MMQVLPNLDNVAFILVIRVACSGHRCICLCMNPIHTALSSCTYLYSLHCIAVWFCYITQKVETFPCIYM